MSRRMKKHPDDSPMAVATLLTQLAMASWETMFHRTVMMVQGTCSPAEYQRMTTEKVAAMQQSMLALATGRGQAAALVPFVTRTRANVRRLRKA